MATMISPSVVLMYSSYPGCGYDGNSKVSMLLPDQGLHEGVWKLFIDFKRTYWSLIVRNPELPRLPQSFYKLSRSSSISTDGSE